MNSLRAPEAAVPDRLSVVVAPMRRRHLPSVLRIEKQVYPRPWTMGLYLGELALPSRVYLVAKLGNRVVGYGGLMMNLNEGHITTLAVDPALQHYKIGTRVLLVLASRAVERGAQSLTLEVRVTNRAAQELYRKFGFAPAGVRKGYYAEVNEDALVMWAHDVDSEGYAARLGRIEQALPTPLVTEG
jgi:[ribosomal protein S18]-alanine N-acetyltransferase